MYKTQKPGALFVDNQSFYLIDLLGAIIVHDQNSSCQLDHCCGTESTSAGDVVHRVDPQAAALRHAVVL